MIVTGKCLDNIYSTITTSQDRNIEQKVVKIIQICQFCVTWNVTSV